mmetsp:Transcript_18933/g.23086  ORF Transcript_18933/g.23086 Transcript_18933/m.23086 type:complete len:94 (+) Transcript_18933:222-503(+)
MISSGSNSYSTRGSYSSKFRSQSKGVLYKKGLTLTKSVSVAPRFISCSRLNILVYEWVNGSNMPKFTEKDLCESTPKVGHKKFFRLRIPTPNC